MDKISLTFTFFFIAVFISQCRLSPESEKTNSLSTDTVNIAPSNSSPKSLDITKRDTVDYEGPLATLFGTIRITGDEPPRTPMDWGKNCNEAENVYGKLFRKGKKGELADALVTATHYQEKIAPLKKLKTIEFRNCALSSRTVGLTLGQVLDVVNRDSSLGMVPLLDGMRNLSLKVALPFGKPISLKPTESGHYLLKDEMRNFITAEVYVLAFPTHAVTDLEGHYRIERIPVGQIQVHAFLPQTKGQVEKTIELKEGENTLDLTLEYKNLSKNNSKNQLKIK